MLQGVPLATLKRIATEGTAVTKIYSDYTAAELAAIDAKRGAKTRSQFQKEATLAATAPASSGTPTTSGSSTGTVVTTTATVSGTGTTTTSTTTATSTTSTKIRRGTRMGFSCGPTVDLWTLDRIAELGFGWIRVSHEMGWNGTVAALATTVVEAQKRGIKVMQSPQISGKTYTGGLTQLQQFGQFCADCASTGIHAMSIGNEWNHLPFWKGPTSTDPNNATRTIPQYLPTSQAGFTWYGAQQARKINPNLPISTPGMSPESSVLNPYLWWPNFFDCDATNMKATNFTAVDVHAYVWPEDPSTNPHQWNPALQTPDLATAAQARGMSGEVWWTEVGAPGYPSGTTIPTIRGYLLDEARQQICYDGYFKVIRAHEAAGIKLRNIMWVTIKDGQSVSAPGPEQYFGILRADGSKKPTWQMLKNFGDELVVP